MQGGSYDQHLPLSVMVYANMHYILLGVKMGSKKLLHIIPFDFCFDIEEGYDLSTGQFTSQKKFIYIVRQY
jgi:hypothetical protein